MKLNKNVSLRYRDTFRDDDPRVWYVDQSRVVLSLTLGGFSNMIFNADGPTPDIALHRMWQAVLDYFNSNADAFFLLYSCPSNVPIPGDTPQAWVRWDDERDTWIDVIPTEQALRAHKIPTDRVVSYKHHIFAGSR
jgi:hypothetical protein